MRWPDLSHRPPVLIALGGLIAMAIGIGIGRFVYTPILPPMMAALGFGNFVSGLIASANFAGYLAGALLLSLAPLPGPTRPWLPAALLVSAATTAGMGLTESVPVFIALRFAGGMASALALILSSALVLERLAASRRGGLVALHFSGVGIGIAISAGLVASQLAAGMDWAAMWLACGALSLLGALAVPWLVPPGTVPVTAPPASTGGSGNAALRRMTFAYGLFGFGYVITATFLVAIVRETAAIRPLEPVIWIVVGLAAAPSISAWTLLARRIGTGPAYAIAALTEAVGVLASVLWPAIAGICVAGVLLGGTFMGLTALGLMRARELATGDPRRAMAALTCAFGVGQIVGPASAGMMSDALGGFAIPSLAAAAALILAAGLARR
jgi:predicted MFS family arabinose efflux permease